ncbi:carbamoyltransferase [Leptospira weilii str. 2006001853]|uniref:Carbamoyltransferase n=1 Tax=Leptospira weilii str. 2006001853 TaxID=1001589 RepID=A0A828Z6U7_9LEPT|nr:carbamoyltransferase C-terminal domain-containing protein [Leptospira weilii]EKR66057.1 carbamoyltransferase [Leptospira weilii str. 2006001853]EMN46657.1 carbamoyltransferase [Leptospira weilii str. LNT 1234]QDK23717.1 carbamoyl transferase [Leptospira weilii]QDK26647.1 carbamoyl transferase [Leptospira weilii]
MKILGLSLGELSTAALMVDGHIVACVSEERFTRKKNDEVLPEKSIRYVLETGGITASDLDRVVVAGTELNVSTHIMRTYSSWKISDYIRSMDDYWYPKLYEKKDVDFYKVFKDKIDINQAPGPEKWKKLLKNIKGYYSTKDWPHYKVFLHDYFYSILGRTDIPIVHLDHHTCHAAYAYWGSICRGEDVLTLTADAYGDGLSSTISVIKKDGGLKRVHELGSNEFTLARLYRYVTLILGMKPNEHEYKVMGLAPYAKEEILKKPYEVFSSTMQVNGLSMVYKNKPKDYYYWFRERLNGSRFDGIAGGLQKYTEEIVLKYISNALKSKKKTKLAYSGGVSMNIKTNMLLHEESVLKELYVPGSGGDESLAIGACYAYMDQEIGSRELTPLANLYLGPDMDVKEEATVVSEARKQFFVKEYNPTLAAQMLAKGFAFGRAVGRGEFGARSLGNRAILADPRNFDTIGVINEKIKNRDFWMPFAPSVLREDLNEYTINPKNIDSPFMSIGFRTTAKGKEALRAATHPSDATVRPNTVTQKSNREYYTLIKEFKKITGVGGLLNTSFNLHGEPIVNGSKDAYRVFLKSGLDAIILPNWIISKKEF